MGHVPGAEKGNFLIRGRGRPTVYGGRTSGNLSIRGPEVSLGSLRVGTIHVHAPTPHTPPLQAFLADFSQQTTRFSHLLAMVCFQSSPRALGCRIDGVCRTGDYPPPDLPREASRSRSAPEKSVQFGPDRALICECRGRGLPGGAGVCSRAATLKYFGLGERLGCILNLGHSFEAIEADLRIC